MLHFLATNRSVYNCVCGRFLGLLSYFHCIFLGLYFFLNSVLTLDLKFPNYTVLKSYNHNNIAVSTTYLFEILRTITYLIGNYYYLNESIEHKRNHTVFRKSRKSLSVFPFRLVYLWKIYRPSKSRILIFFLLWPTARTTYSICQKPFLK